MDGAELLRWNKIPQRRFFLVELVFHRRSSCDEELARRHTPSHRLCRPVWATVLVFFFLFWFVPVTSTRSLTGTRACDGSKTSDIYLSAGRRHSCAALKRNRVVNWQKAVAALQTSFPSKLPKFPTFVFILVCEEGGVQSEAARPTYSVSKSCEAEQVCVCVCVCVCKYLHHISDYLTLSPISSIKSI